MPAAVLSLGWPGQVALLETLLWPARDPRFVRITTVHHTKNYFDRCLGVPTFQRTRPTKQLLSRLKMSSHSHDDNEEAYYVTSDAKDDSLYDKLTENGSYQRPVLEDIVAYLVSLDGVEQRGAYVEKSGSRKSGKKIKKEKIAYFKGSRVGDCFPDVSGHVTEPNDPRLLGLGNALINQSFCIEHVIDNPKERLMKPVEDGTTSWRPDGFYVWTSVARNLAQNVCCSKDLIQVRGGLLRQRRQQQRSTGDGTHETSGSSRSVKVDRVSSKSRGGLNWLNMFFLFLLFGPPCMMGVMWVSDFLSTTVFKSSNHDRLMSFYAQNNPTKATTEFVEKTLLKYQGREEQLFTKLQRKYEAKEIRRKARERAEEEDAKLKQRGSNVEE